MGRLASRRTHVNLLPSLIPPYSHPVSFRTCITQGSANWVRTTSLLVRSSTFATTGFPSLRTTAGRGSMGWLLSGYPSSMTAGMVRCRSCTRGRTALGCPIFPRRNPPCSLSCSSRIRWEVTTVGSTQVSTAPRIDLTTKRSAATTRGLWTQAREVCGVGLSKDAVLLTRATP